jgi:hypothetical protein
VRVKHDRAVIDITVLLEQTRDIRLSQARVDTSDEEVGARVDGTLILFLDGLASQGSSVGDFINKAISYTRSDW